MAYKTNILLIHGVGDLPNEDTRLKSQKLIQSDLNDEESIRFYWYDWNKSIQNLQPEDEPIGVQTITNATKLSARLEYPQIKKNSTHFGIPWFEMMISKIQLLVTILFLFHFVLFFFSWMATYLPTEPPPLTLRVRIDSLLFPPLDPLLLDEIYPMIRGSLLFSALAALVIVPILHIFIAASLREIPLRVAIRSAVLDLLRPLIGVITSPTTVIALLILIAGGFALLYGFFSRPVAITDLQGNWITYGSDRILGVLGLPLARISHSEFINHCLINCRTKG